MLYLICPLSCQGAILLRWRRHERQETRLSKLEYVSTNQVNIGLEHNLLGGNRSRLRSVVSQLLLCFEPLLFTINRLKFSQFFENIATCVESNVAVIICVSGIVTFPGRRFTKFRKLRNFIRHKYRAVFTFYLRLLLITKEEKLFLFVCSFIINDPIKKVVFPFCSL